MAKKIQVVLIDDLDGGPADETLSFAIEGVAYDIDLSVTNAARLRNAIAPFVAHARKVGRSSGQRRRTAGAPNRSAEIRRWARAQGLKVNERGRIPADLVAKFEAAH